MNPPYTTEQIAAGRQMMEKVYGRDLLPPEFRPGETPYVDETVGHLFGDIWARPGLSVRDRRLLVLGATAALGRADLIEVQVRGALAGAELNKAELDEVLLQLAFYVGWGNSTSLMRGIHAALAAHASDSAA